MPKKSDEEKHRENMVKQYKAAVEVIDGGTPLEDIVNEVFHPDVTALYGDILVPFLTRFQEVLRFRGWGGQPTMVCDGTIGGATIKSAQGHNVYQFSFIADGEPANFGSCIGKQVRGIFQQLQGELLPEAPKVDTDGMAADHAAGKHRMLPNLGCADCLFEIAQRRMQRAVESEPTSAPDDVNPLTGQEDEQDDGRDEEKGPQDLGGPSVPPDFDPDANTPEE